MLRTYANTKGATGGGSASDLLSTLTAAEISVTTTATATISRMHVCTGTSADYTVTLPAASGLAGKLLGIRLAGVAAMSKLVTIDGNGSETIDGSLTRILWAGESCILLCDGSNWFKIAGKSIPMILKLSRSLTDQTGIVASTATPIAMDTQDASSSCPAAMWDSGNGRPKVLRPGRYLTTSYAYCTGLSTYVYIGLFISGVQQAEYQQSSAVTAVGAGAYIDMFTLAVNDYPQPMVYGSTGGGTITVLGSAAPALCQLVEVPQW